MANMRVRRRLEDEEMNRGTGLLEAGLSQRPATRRLGVSQSVVLGWGEQRYQTQENVMRRPVVGVGGTGSHKV